MKHTIIIFLFILLCTPAFAKEYEISEFYIKKDLPDGAKVKDNFGNIREAETLYIPYNDYKKGSYEVTLTKIDTGIYQIDGTDYVIEIRNCYEYAYSKKAVIVIDNPYGYNKGKLFIE